jgi:hypothetical protein
MNKKASIFTRVSLLSSGREKTTPGYHPPAQLGKKPRDSDAIAVDIVHGAIVVP